MFFVYLIDSFIPMFFPNPPVWKDLGLLEEQITMLGEVKSLDEAKDLVKKYVYEKRLALSNLTDLTLKHWTPLHQDLHEPNGFVEIEKNRLDSILEKLNIM